MKKVFISIGHGGADSGAVGNGLKEKDINLVVAKRVRDILKLKGFNVKMSREGDEDDSVKDEVKECNAFNPDISVSIHTNAGGGDGFEVFCNKSNVEGVLLSSYIEQEVLKIGQNSRGVKGGMHLYYIKNTKCTSVLVETAFIDNAKDISIVDTKEKQIRYGDAIADGILAFCGITSKNNIGVGTKIKIKSEATKWATGQAIPSWAKGKEYIVDRVDDNAYLLDKNGICSLISKSDVVVV